MGYLVIERSDGGVTIRNPIPDDADVQAEVDSWEAKPKNVARGLTATSFQWHEDDPTPGDRGFRDAWKRGVAGVDVDMPKARVIHMDRIRVARDKQLNELDKQTLKAVGQGDAAEQARIEAEKQRLRDLPQTFDLTNASTPEALAALWPTDLPR